MLKSYTAKYLHEHLKGITWMNWWRYTVFIPGSFSSIQLNTSPFLSSSYLECRASDFLYGVFWDLWLVLREPSLYSKWTFDFDCWFYLLLETSFSLVGQLSKCWFLLYSLCVFFFFFTSNFLCSKCWGSKEVNWQQLISWYYHLSVWKEHHQKAHSFLSNNGGKF